MSSISVIAVLCAVTAALVLFYARQWLLGSFVVLGGVLTAFCLFCSQIFADLRLAEFYYLAALSSFGLTTAICGATLLWRTWKRKLGFAFGTLALVTMLAGDALAMYATAKQLPHVGYVLEKLQAGDIR